MFNKNLLELLKKNWLFASILIIQLLVLVFTFTFFKQGYHSDELYEYGFANSIDKRMLTNEDNGNSLDRVWTDSNAFLEYIAVNKNERFSYPYIFKHAEMEYFNPPLKLFLLHTICSFFPNVFSKWFSFSINIVSFIFLQIFLFLLLKKLTKSYSASVAGIILFGFSAGCLNSFVFLRMYSTGMAFGVAFLYFSFCYFLEKVKKKRVIYLILSFLFLFLGAYTLHLFLVFAFPLVLIICIFCLIHKEFKRFFMYGFSSLFSVILSFAAFPQTFSDTGKSVESYSYANAKFTDALQFRMYCYNATLDNFGFSTSVYSNPWIKNSIVIILFIFIVSIPFFILIRKEDWFKKFLNLLKKRLLWFLKNLNYSYVIVTASICSIFFVIFICSKRTSVNSMGLVYSARYIYLTYPLICISSICIIYYLLKFFVDKKWIISLIVVAISFVFCTYSQILTSQAFLMQHEEEGVTLKDIESNANCLIMLVSDWTIICFAPELYNTNSYYFVDYNKYDQDKDCFNGLDKSQPLYIIMDYSVVLTKEQKEYFEKNKDEAMSVLYNRVGILEDDVFDYYLSLGGINKIEYVGSDEIFCRPLKIYRVHFE